MEKLALVSVSDKSGLVPFAKALVETHGYRLLSTGGTAKILEKEGLPVTEVGAHTGFPEMMEGRIKTLHPKIHGGILCRRDKKEHLKQAENQKVALIDLVVVNLYPFNDTIKRQGCTLEEAIENIDIGGPAMLRSAAKNHQSVTVVCDPGDYERVAKALNEEELKALRAELALKVFRHTSKYDRAIADYLQHQQAEPDMACVTGMSQEYHLSLDIDMLLRYGENPHQKAALYGRFCECYEQLQGKDLSYNNILDITAATYLIGEFQRPTVAILKHTNPCGVASADSLEEAWQQAFATDEKAPFGGIIVVNRTLDEDLAGILRSLFCEVIIAPGFTDKAREVLAAKKNLRLMVAKDSLGVENLQQVRSVVGGVLVQDWDKTIDVGRFREATDRKPTDEELQALLFAWRVVKHVKSNAIVYAKAERTLGIGAGQMSRVDSSQIAVWKAKDAGLSLEGAVIASDAFFPFPDALEAAINAGATAAIQPGGSKGDDAVIKAANEGNMAMIFTHKRHFCH